MTRSRRHPAQPALSPPPPHGAEGTANTTEPVPPADHISDPNGAVAMTLMAVLMLLLMFLVIAIAQSV